MRVVVAELAPRRAGVLAWTLNRPYFDLGTPSGPVPLHTEQVVLAGSSLAERRFAGLGPNMAMSPAFRGILVVESGLPEYRADRLDELPAPLRSPAWQQAADAVEKAEILGDAHRLALGRLLMALTMYDEAAAVLDRPPLGDPAEGGAAADLVVTRLLTRYVVGTGDRDELVGEVRAAEATVPSGTFAHVSVLLLLASLVATPRTVEPVGAILRAARDSAEAAGAGFDDLDRRRLVVRVLGVHAKLATVSRPELARQLVDEGIDLLRGAAEHDSVLAREAMRRLLDRRCLLGRLTGDDSEEATAEQVVALDPLDSKAWLQLGNARANAGHCGRALDAYRHAAALGPLYTGMAHHCAGTMLRRLDRDAEAAREYLLAAQVDPLSSSTASALRELGDRLGWPYLHGVADELRQVASNAEEVQP